MGRRHRMAARISPEVIEDGVTGFIVEWEADAVAAIGRARHSIEAAFVKHLGGDECASNGRSIR